MTKTDHTYIVILAGGAGTRFWPVSREHLPKQFLDITGAGKTMLRQTFNRFVRIVPSDHIFVMTHAQYAPLVQNELPELSSNQIIAEPSRNNTAPAIAVASIKLAQCNPDAVCIVAPADHLITREDEFERILTSAVEHAREKNSIVTLGIHPTRPDTGYGYIEFDKAGDDQVHKVKSFREKPDQQTAESYLRQGGFAWNAGIFIWKLSTILRNVHQYAPAIYETLMAGKEVFNTDAEKSFLEQHYPRTEKISIDYAILERSTEVYTIPCDIGWSDIGTWNSLYEYAPKDADQNAKLGSNIYTEDATQNLIRSADARLVVIKGLDNYIIVDTPDCLLICPKADEQAIRELKDRLKEKGFGEFL